MRWTWGAFIGNSQGAKNGPDPPFFFASLSRPEGKPGHWRCHRTSFLRIFGCCVSPHFDPLPPAHPGFPGGSVVKNPPASAGDIRNVGLTPGSKKMPWRRKWQPTPVFLPGKSHGQKSLTGYNPWGHKESDTTERLEHTDTHTPRLSLISSILKRTLAK